MIERDGETWLSLAEMAERSGYACQRNLGRRLDAAGVLREAFHVPTRGKPTTYARVQDFEAWLESRRATPPGRVRDVPPHMENVILDVKQAARLVSKSRKEVNKVVNEGRLPGVEVEGLSQLVRVGDLVRRWSLDAAIYEPLAARIEALMASNSPT